MTAIDGGGLLALLPPIRGAFSLQEEQVREQGCSARPTMNVGVKFIRHIKANKANLGK